MELAKVLNFKSSGPLNQTEIVRIRSSSGTLREGQDHRSHRIDEP